MDAASPARTLDQVIARTPRQAVIAAAERAMQGRAELLHARWSHMAPQATLRQMIGALGLEPHHRVLEIGAGAGWSTLLLAQLVAEVHAVERIPELARHVEAELALRGLKNVRLHIGEGEGGWSQAAPYDAILVSAPSARISPPWLSQLKPGGCLVLPVGQRRDALQLLRLRVRSSGAIDRDELGPARFGSGLADVLAESGQASPEVLRQASELAATGELSLEAALLKSGLVAEHEVYRALALLHGMALWSLEQCMERLDRRVFRAFSRSFVLHNHVVPLCVTDRVLHLVSPQLDLTLDPLCAAVDAVRCEHHLITPTDLARLMSVIELETRTPSGARKAMPALKDDLLARQQEDLDAQLVSIFDALLLDAIGSRASDIHLERYEERVRVRFRIDGDLRDITRYNIDAVELAGIVNIIKINANLDIAERRLPQGGRFRRKVGNSAWDVRVQTQPALHGEHVVMRLLPQDMKLLTIEDLGFSPEIARRYRRMISNPAGLLLVVGPTGSGKSTTLYAGLQVLSADPARKVITVEDPIEYSIQGIQQTQVAAEIGFAFHDAMRAFVREDPDVILVGEIRDGETALEALRASQTGHLVLSTLHCNDAVDAVQRLLDLGMHPNSIAAELIVIIAQRLAKRICAECREPDVPDPALVEEIYPDGLPPGFVCWRGRGCPRCDGSGSRGRVALIEFLQVTPPLRRAIAQSLPIDALRAVARAEGMIAMRESALDLVQQGVVAFSELPAVIPAEQLAPLTSFAEL